MNVGDIITSQEEFDRLPQSTMIRHAGDGRWESVELTTPVSELTHRLALADADGWTVRELAEWILDNFVAKEDSVHLVVVDNDGDKWFRNDDGTYSREGYIDCNWSVSFYHKSLDYIKAEHGFYGGQ